MLEGSLADQAHPVCHVEASCPRASPVPRSHPSRRRPLPLSREGDFILVDGDPLVKGKWVRIDDSTTPTQADRFPDARLPWSGLSEPAEIRAEPVSREGVRRLMLSLALLAFAQQGPPPAGGPVPADDPSQDARPAAEAPAARVAWYTSWEQALQEAERHNRPILLQSAAPQCGGVPGMW